MTEPLGDDLLELLNSALDLARDGATDDLVALVRAGLPANLTAPTGDTLLILAAYYDHADTVQALLDAGADPERINDRGQTALAAAVFRQNAVAVSALLAAGAGPGTGPRSAIRIADFFGLVGMRRLLDGAGRES